MQQETSGEKWSICQEFIKEHHSQVLKYNPNYNDPVTWLSSVSRHMRIRDPSLLALHFHSIVRAKTVTEALVFCQDMSMYRLTEKDIRLLCQLLQKWIK